MQRCNLSGLLAFAGGRLFKPSFFVCKENVLLENECAKPREFEGRALK